VLTRSWPRPWLDSTQVLAYAAALEEKIEHPLAPGNLAESASRWNCSCRRGKILRRLPGLGAKGFLKDKSCLIGNRMLMENEGISIDALG